MDAMMMVAICGLAALSGTASIMMAAGKRRRRWLWGSVGLLFNVPGMLVVTVLPPSSSAPGAQTESPSGRTEQAERQERERRVAS